MWHEGGGYTGVGRGREQGRQMQVSKAVIKADGTRRNQRMEMETRRLGLANCYFTEESSVRGQQIRHLNQDEPRQKHQKASRNKEGELQRERERALMKPNGNKPKRTVSTPQSRE